MLWFMMDRSNKPLYMENNNTGEVYQVLNVMRKSKDINSEEDNEEDDYDIYEK